KQFDKALFYWTKTLVAAQNLSIKSQVAETHNNLSLLYATTKNYEKSLMHQIAYRTLADSLMNSRIARDINQLEVEHRTAEKDKLIAQTQREAERKNFMIILAGGGF